MPDRLTALLRADTGGTPVIELEGEIDRDAEGPLFAAWEQVPAASARVVLDFGRTEYINSSGLAILVQLLARARAEGREVHVVGLTDHYREIFEITRLVDFVTLLPDARAIA